MTFDNDVISMQESIELVKNVRIAICGHLPAACKTLRDIGVNNIDKFNDAIDLAFKLRRGEEYHLVLVYAPQGEGIDTDMPYKVACDGEWKSIPVKLLNEPACSSALIELKSAVHAIARKSLAAERCRSG